MKILCVFSHPDDEIIFGWPIFQISHIKKHLVCVTGNKQRLETLDKVSKILDFTWECVSIPEKSVENHTEELSKHILQTVSQFNPLLIFTHNPHGEYQHPDHLAVFKTLYSMKKVKNLLITDMSISLSGSGFPETPLAILEKEQKKFYTQSVCEVYRDTNIYSQVRQIYRDNNCWTWGKRNIDIAKLYFAKTKNLHRKFQIEILSSLLCPNNCNIAEIGIYKGGTTEYLSQCENIGKIYAIDPWKNIDNYSDHKKLLKYLKRTDSHGESINVDSWEELYLYVNNKLSKYKHVAVLRQTSQEAISSINEDLDLVFIDGDHSYESVLLDLNLWVPKIKSKGIVMGHDFTWTLDNGDKKGLVLAVMEYFEKNKDKFEHPLDVERNHLINRTGDRVWWQRKK